LYSGPVQENKDNLFFVYGTRYYYVVENLADIRGGFVKFLKLRIEHLKATNKVYVFAFIGPFGSPFVNNILYLDNHNQKNLINVWTIVNNFVNRSHSKSKKINKNIKTEFRYYLDDLFKREYTFFQYYFFFKTWIRQYRVTDPELIRMLWQTVLSTHPELRF